MGAELYVPTSAAEAVANVMKPNLWGPPDEVTNVLLEHCDAIETQAEKFAKNMDNRYSGRGNEARHAALRPQLTVCVAVKVLVKMAAAEDAMKQAEYEAVVAKINAGAQENDQ